MSKYYQRIIASYQILGVEVGAPFAEVRKSYRRLIKRWHPDVSDEPAHRAEAQARRFNEAIAAIKSLKPVDVEGAVRFARSALARQQRVSSASRARRRPPGQTRKAAKPRPRKTAPRKTARPRPRKAAGVARIRRQGRDIIGLVEVTREEALAGGFWEFRLLTCHGCAGWGAAADTELRICRHCRGLGVLPPADGGLGLGILCAACRGRGNRHAKTCASCLGRGEAVRHTVRCRIPPGDGESRFGVLSGLGHPGLGGDKPGDLYLLISVV